MDYAAEAKREVGSLRKRYPEKPPAGIRAELDAMEQDKMNAKGMKVHEGRKLDVLVRDAASVMRRQHHIHLVVDVRPFGMMVHLVGLERDARHEAEGCVEIVELELLCDRIAAIDGFPAIEFAERVGRACPLGHVPAPFPNLNPQSDNRQTGRHS